MPDEYTLAPSRQHGVQRHPEGPGADLLLGTLVPGEQIEVSYLSNDPVGLGRGRDVVVRHAEGVVKPHAVLPGERPREGWRELVGLVVALLLVAVLASLVSWLTGIPLK
jgi:hypothetical protein